MQVTLDKRCKDVSVKNDTESVKAEEKHICVSYGCCDKCGPVKMLFGVQGLPWQQVLMRSLDTSRRWVCSPTGKAGDPAASCLPPNEDVSTNTHTGQENTQKHISAKHAYHTEINIHVIHHVCGTRVAVIASGKAHAVTWGDVEFLMSSRYQTAGNRRAELHPTDSHVCLSDVRSQHFKFYTQMHYTPRVHFSGKCILERKTH